MLVSNHQLLGGGYSRD